MAKKKPEDLGLGGIVQDATVEESLPDGSPVATAQNPRKGPRNPRESFLRLGDRRMNRAVKDIRAIIPLANKSAYEYTKEEADFLCKAIADALADLRRAFEGQKQSRPTLTLRAVRASEHGNNGDTAQS